MTPQQIRDRFPDATLIEITDDGKAYIHFSDCAYPIIIEVEND
jgi:hypothetical protein